MTIQMNDHINYKDHMLLDLKINLIIRIFNNKK